MAKKAKKPVPLSGELCYQLPESAHELLGRVRNELGMLVQVSERHCCDREEILQLSSTMLSQYFARLEWELEDVLEACLAPSEVAR
ncbi:XAC0095 family protein [Dyella mobilis]|uniref:Uncharacterized protein n=1 Tax=Dyella mobilis TaxID=1849582 RepID=A0ABS2KCC2_9GAMM|nr:hypothetical protein [Dyella mobilis]MBM7128503.1 hypothetical protein [Dyella mobilis]GLQ99596.1 hypothetical protein GCM10007863_40160 [Dyella mobilis]